MRISLDITKSLENNASKYFDKSKKAKKKIEGARKALEKTKLKLEKAELVPEKTVKTLEQRKAKKREWYEKFRWFISSDGLLVLGGKDATTNEILIKKHTEKNDVVFHTDMAGSPFVVIKTDKKPPQTTIQEAADFTLAYSRAWKQGLTTASVFYVTPEQVSKKANSGEFLGRGSFMIYGETTYVDTKINFAIGIHEGKIMGGPITAIKANCKEAIEITQGKKKASEVAKKIRFKIGGDLDDIIRVLPAGGVDSKV